jgi:hypothetical protein
MNVGCALENILRSAKEYDRKESFLKDKDPVELKADAKKATEFMFEYFFRGVGEISFRSAILRRSSQHWRPVGKSLWSPYSFIPGWVPDPGNEWGVQRLLEEYNGEREAHSLRLNPKDRDLVERYFMYACPILVEYGYNPVLYVVRKIEEGEIWEAYYFFLGVENVGERLAAFFLRDITDIYGLRGKLNPGDLPYVFPVDTWVRKAVNTLWGQLVSETTGKGQRKVV